MDLSSVIELEIEAVKKRKELMGVVFKYLKEAGVEAELTSEKLNIYLNTIVDEPLIKIKGKNINTIRLIEVTSGGCDVPGYIMRFQYEIHPEKQIASESIQRLKAETRLIKEGKVIGFFGGKVSGVKWEGGKLAENLNQDLELSASMFKCLNSWAHLEFQIESSSTGVYIAGPRFVGEEHLRKIYESKSIDELRHCLFGFMIVEKIAGRVKEYMI
jgi:hypothetical protein